MRCVVVFALGLLVVNATGCSNQPKGPSRTEYRPSSAGSQAMAQYDNNGNGELDGSEIDSCPALRVALDRIDSDSNGTISADEISERPVSYTHLTLPTKA